MILVDANLLIYAFVREFPEHEAARSWLDRQLADAPRVGLPWPSLLAFVRLVINPRIFQAAPSMQQAWGQAREWLKNDNVWIPGPGARHAEIFESLLPDAGPSARIVPDVHLAALAIEHGLALMSADRGFARFRDLRWSNPLDAR